MNGKVVSQRNEAATLVHQGSSLEAIGKPPPCISRSQMFNWYASLLHEDWADHSWNLQPHEIQTLDQIVQDMTQPLLWASRNRFPSISQGISYVWRNRRNHMANEANEAMSFAVHFGILCICASRKKLWPKSAASFHICSIWSIWSVWMQKRFASFRSQRLHHSRVDNGEVPNAWGAELTSLLAYTLYLLI